MQIFEELKGSIENHKHWFEHQWSSWVVLIAGLGIVSGLRLFTTQDLLVGIVAVVAASAMMVWLGITMWYRPPEVKLQKTLGRVALLVVIGVFLVFGSKRWISIAGVIEVAFDITFATGVFKLFGFLYLLAAGIVMILGYFLLIRREKETWSEQISISKGMDQLALAVGAVVVLAVGL